MGYLVERLLAEVLRLEQLGLGLRHKVGDRSDIRLLETVGRANRQLELPDVAEEVRVSLGSQPRLVALGRLPSVHPSRTSRCRLPTAGSTWKFTRSTGEKSASLPIQPVTNGARDSQ